MLMGWAGLTAAVPRDLTVEECTKSVALQPIQFQGPSSRLFRPQDQVWRLLWPPWREIVHVFASVRAASDKPGIAL